MDEDLNLSSELEFSVPGGLIFSDDDDVIVIDPDSDELFSSFPKDKTHHKNLILGGPQPHDLSKYPEGKREDVWVTYKKERKAYTDKEQSKQAKIAHKAATCTTSATSGCNKDHLHIMTNVKCDPLLVGHTLSTRDILCCKKRKRPLRMFCRVCHKFNHNTEDCYKNPLNKWKLNNIDLEHGDNNENNDGKEGSA